MWRDDGTLGRSDMVLPQSDGRRSLSGRVAVGRRLDVPEGVGEAVRFWYFRAIALRDALSKAGRLNLLALLAMLLMERVRARLRGTGSWSSELLGGGTCKVFVLRSPGVGGASSGSEETGGFCGAGG